MATLSALGLRVKTLDPCGLDYGGARLRRYLLGGVIVELGVLGLSTVSSVLSSVLSSLLLSFSFYIFDLLVTRNSSSLCICSAVWLYL